MAWSEEPAAAKLFYGLFFAVGLTSNLLCFARAEDQPEHPISITVSYAIILLLQLRSLYKVAEYRNGKVSQAVSRRALDILALLAALHLLFVYITSFGAFLDIDGPSWAGLAFADNFAHNEAYRSRPLGRLLSDVDVLLAVCVGAHLAVRVAAR